MTFTFAVTQKAHVRAMQDMARRTLAYKLSWAVLVGLVLLSLLVAAGSREGFGNGLVAQAVVREAEQPLFFCKRG